MTMTQVRNPFTAPVITPLPGTLLSVASISEGLTHLEPQGVYESFNCLSMAATPTWPCPAALLAAPVMGASATATTGGTLAAGTYKAKVTAVNTRGETVGSAEASQVTTGATSTVTFNWAAVAGAAEYHLYITNGAAGSEALYVVVPTGTLTKTITNYPPTGQIPGTPPTSNTAVIPVTKDLSQTAHWEDGFQFGVYGGFTCKAPGYDSETGANLRRAFEARESIGVERALMANRFVDGGALEWSAPTDLTPTPGTAVDLAVALALLEGHAAVNYAGVPTIHVPRSVGTLMSCCFMTVEGGKFYTKQGSKVASGGGYETPNTGPTGAAPPANTKWMFASGEVQLARQDLIMQDDMNRSTNELVTLIERVYMATVDCYTSAVLVKVAAE